MLLTVLALAHTSETRPLGPNKRDTGVITFRSKCPYPVWVQVVSQTVGNPAWQLMKPGYWLPYTMFPPLSATDCDGISIKLGREDFTGLIASPITQAEIAWNLTAGFVDYDASDLNAYGPSPFSHQGYVIWADVAATDQWPMCKTIHCAAGENPCKDAYWYGEC